MARNVIISAAIPMPLVLEAENVAKNRGVTLSRLVREALQAYVQNSDTNVRPDNTSKRHDRQHAK